MPTPDPKLSLQQLERDIADADAIAAAGKDKDGAITALAKGVSRGLGELAALLKGGRMRAEPDGDEAAGGGAPPAKPGADKPVEGGDGGEDEEPEGDEPDGDEPDGDEAGGGGPGYEDMRMGGEPGEEYVDATEYVLALEKKVDRLQKSADRSNRELRELRTTLNGFIGAYASTMGPLAKGVLNLHESLAELPAAVHNPGLDARRAAVRHAIAPTEAPNGIDVVKLAKGMKNRVITEDQARHFKVHGRFAQDDAENTRLLEAVKAL